MRREKKCIRRKWNRSTDDKSDFIFQLCFTSFALMHEFSYQLFMDIRLVDLRYRSISFFGLPCERNFIWLLDARNSFLNLAECQLSQLTLPHVYIFYYYMHRTRFLFDGVKTLDVFRRDAVLLLHRCPNGVSCMLCNHRGVHALFSNSSPLRWVNKL